MLYPNPRMLLSIGMADAYGAGAEYLKFPRDHAVRDEILRFKGYIAHPTHGHAAGHYTDDTEMSVANTKVLLADAAPYAPRMFADEYVTEFRRGGQRKGYSRGFQAFLEEIRDGGEFLARIRPDSEKNGAAMRSVPFGVLPTVAEVLDVSTLQARLTHDTPVGLFSARAVALMSHFALRVDKPLRDLPGFCLAHLPNEDVRRFRRVFVNRWPSRPVTSSSGMPVGVTTVHAVVDLVTHQGSLMGILEHAIRWGGDVDSVVAIAWGIASARYRDEHLPEFLERDLEGGNRHTGAAYLRGLGERLMTKFA